MKLVLLQILDIHIRKLVSLGPFKKVLISANLEYWQWKILTLTSKLTNQRHNINTFKIISVHRTLRDAL